jgi:sulfide:quinone oxidoreductase
MANHVDVLVLGAGFGGLELSSRLATALGDQVDITLIDRSDSFVFGFSKLDMMFGSTSLDDVRLSYADIALPHVRFRQETITAIDPGNRRVTTDLDSYEADVMVIALGAGYDVAATPGLAEAGNEFYSVDGALRLREKLKSFGKGAAVVGVCGPVFKCPPAPSEAALMLDDFLRERGLREGTEITLVMPFGAPVPPSPDTSQALLAAFAERGIEWVPDALVGEIDSSSNEAVLADGRRLACDLFLGIPVHRVPWVVAESGLCEDEWIPVDHGTLATRIPDVYALGDVASVGTAKAGFFAEGQARVVADQLAARIKGDPTPPNYDGTASCYIGFGRTGVARVNVDFFSAGGPAGTYSPPSAEIAQEKEQFAVERRQRWLGR